MKYLTNAMNLAHYVVADTKFIIDSDVDATSNIRDAAELSTGSIAVPGDPEGVDFTFRASYADAQSNSEWAVFVGSYSLDTSGPSDVVEIEVQRIIASSNNNLAVNFSDVADSIRLTGVSSHEDLNALAGLLNASTVITGEVRQLAHPNVPSGWLSCDGQPISRALYPELFTALGVIYGAGDGTTTFNLPDYRGQFLRGFDDGAGVDSGRVLGALQADALKSHTHTGTVSINNDTHNHSASTGNDTHNHSASTGNDTHNHSFFGDPNTNAGTTGGAYMGNTRLGDSSGLVNYTSSVQNDTHNHSVTVNNDTHNHTVTVNNDTHSHTGTVSINAAGASETRPTNHAVYFIIKV